MAVYKRGNHWHLDVAVGGIRYREPLRTTDKREAKGLEKQRVAEIHAGKGSSLAGREFSRLPFTEAVAKLVEERKPHVAERTHALDKERSRPLCKYFADRPLNRLTASDVSAYQMARLDGTGFACPVKARTVNMELCVLRQALDRGKVWSRLKEDVKALPEKTVPIGRALTREQLQHLFAVAASNERWLVVRCAMTIALATAGRGVELKHLRWRHVDLFAKMIHFERSKTSGGIRAIPMTEDATLALAALRARAEFFGSVDVDHFVFPACERQKFDPVTPMKGWRTAWRSLVKLAAKVASGKADVEGRDPIEAARPFERLRFHDLRHCAVTTLAEAGVSDATLMSISGHLSQRMIEHYSHIRLQAKREAVAHLPRGLFSGSQAEVEPVDTVQQLKPLGNVTPGVT